MIETVIERTVVAGLKSVRGSMLKHLLWPFVILSALLCHPGDIQAAGANSRFETAARCTALATAGFSGIPDEPTRVISENYMSAAGNMQARCKVEGYITPSVGYGLQFPVSYWNGKSIEAGC
jgi:hypothetical protein